jgi:hypothetical protein
VFVRSGTTWMQQAYLKASNTGTDDLLGSSISLSGDTLAVCATDEASAATGVNENQADNSTAQAGAVYVYVRSGTTWTQQAYLKASNTGQISGDTLVVGAYGEGSVATGGQRKTDRQRRRILWCSLPIQLINVFVKRGR